MHGANFCGKNRVIDAGGVLEIVLNTGEDFPFAIDEVVVCYDRSHNTVSMREGEIPLHICENMLKFFGGNITTYVEFLEKNLECFLKGDVPRAAERVAPVAKEKDGLKKIDLGADSLPDYKGSLNIEIRAYKSNLSFVMCRRLNIQVGCERCRNVTSLQETKSCPQCSNLLELRYNHVAHNSFLGNLVLRSAKFVCFNTMKYQFGCLECGESYESQIERGVERRFTCHGCSKDIVVKIESLNFKKKEVTKANKPGELPDRGTCVHYKKSFRWFRFPCCNSSFPCDTCHDLASDHKAELASKMICGLCGKEQNVGPACKCGVDIKKVTSFWEGGKGTRDRTKMSKKDGKKYKK